MRGRSRVPLGWQRDNSRDATRVVGMTTQDMREEAAQHGKSVVSSGDAVVTTLFQVIEEPESQIDVTIQETQLIDRNAFGVSRVLEE